MGRALYRKYRPKKLSDVVGQEHITTTIANAIQSGKISHAYLLTGTRGVGKTSLARILAHELNGLEYVDDAAHLDIIEIDAASNRRIDEIRNLRDKVHILPTSNTYKVYIIDEVHMLTKEAFNALLKTLEEPPEHVIFILATTEAHKLPETIISRTQHFSFKPIDTPVIVKHLKSIAKAEKFKIDDAALELIARHGDGSFRDSISLLDQAQGLGDAITVAQVEQLLGVAPVSATNDLAAAIDANDPAAMFELLRSLRSQGFMSGLLAKQLSDLFRERIISDAAYQNDRVLRLLDAFLTVTGSPQADRLLELALLEFMFSGQPATPPAVPSAPQEKIAVAPPKKEPVKPQPTPEEVVAPTNSTFSLDVWPVVIASIKKTHNTLYGILRMAEPRVEDGKLILAFRFAFHQKQLNSDKNRKVVSDVIKQHTGQTIGITCIIDKESKPELNSPSSDTGTKNNIVGSVSDIFGGAEVLNS